MCAQAAALCKAVGAVLLVVDTLGNLSGIKGDSENDAGSALEIMKPLLVMASSGLSVLCVRHDRKGGGEVGDSGRGSSAFSASVDVVMQIKRLEGNGRPTFRNITAVSRFDETPDNLVIELVRADGAPDTYRSHGTETDVQVQDQKVQLLAAVPDGGLLQPALLGDKSNGTKNRAYQELLAEEKLVRTGKGRKGDPYHVWRGDDPLRIALPPPVLPIDRTAPTWGEGAVI
jgi:hypothetical protein